MKCFQIMNNEVLIINDKKQYADTPENFVTDGGNLGVITAYTQPKILRACDGTHNHSVLSESEPVEVTPETVIYDDLQKCCVINNVWYQYPNTALESYIAALDTYIAAKEAREYVPPTFEELKQQALNYQYQLYEAQKHAIAWIDDGSGFGFDTAPEDQNNWQVALTLMEDDVTMYKVYTNINDLTQKSFLQVTRNQMMEAGNIAKQQQYAAYAGFEKIKAEIENCKTESDLKPYLPVETA